jgi:stage V sporulation protein AA
LEIYIKPAKKTSTDKREILLGDIAEVVSAVDGVGRVRIIDVPAGGKTSLLISVVDIIRALKREYPDATVINLGENEMLVNYAPRLGGKSKMLGWLKAAFVAVVLFVGSATAIMSFYTDAQMNRIFENMHYVITGQREERPKLIEIPYCIGLAAGIIVFFNHVGGKRLGQGPTPMEVEMAAYDGETTDAEISLLAEKRKRRADG